MLVLFEAELVAVSDAAGILNGNGNGFASGQSQALIKVAVIWPPRGVFLIIATHRIKRLRGHDDAPGHAPGHLAFNNPRPQIRVALAVAVVIANELREPGAGHVVGIEVNEDLGALADATAVRNILSVGHLETLGA